MGRSMLFGLYLVLNCDYSIHHFGTFVNAFLSF
uniref:Uncharacterized protein n=1 Tax=Myoviridae sp. ct4tH12 TaxID=2825031 RepID=A0A8S5PY61_9CAUD|nr:MAG TPA: hypothetical protein [Myoviridae sp. ct4tH12]